MICFELSSSRRQLYCGSDEDDLTAKHQLELNDHGPVVGISISLDLHGGPAEPPTPQLRRCSYTHAMLLSIRHAAFKKNLRAQSCEFRGCSPAKPKRERGEVW